MHGLHPRRPRVMDYIIWAIFIGSGLCALSGYWLSEIDREHKIDEARRVNQHMREGIARKLAERDSSVDGE